MRGKTAVVEPPIRCNSSRPNTKSAAEGERQVHGAQLSESKRKLDDVFRISQGEECVSETHSQNIECNILEDSARGTTSTQQSDMECEEDLSDDDEIESERCRDPYPNDNEANPLRNRRCAGLCLRCIRRVGRAHIQVRQRYGRASTFDPTSQFQYHIYHIEATSLHSENFIHTTKYHLQIANNRFHDCNDNVSATPTWHVPAIRR